MLSLCKMGLNLSILLRPWSITLLLCLIPLYSTEATWDSTNPSSPSQSPAVNIGQHETNHGLHKILYRGKNTLQAAFFSPTWIKVIEGILQTFIPKPILDFAQHTLPTAIRTVVMYKPPVGITALYISLKVLLSRHKQIVSTLLLEQAEEDAQQRLTTKRYRRRRVKRSLDLDSMDKVYDLFGGVEAVRAELYVAALEDIIQEDTQMYHLDTPSQNIYLQRSDSSSSSILLSITDYASAAKSALLVRASPRSSREFFVERMIPFLGMIDEIYPCDSQPCGETNSPRSRFIQAMSQYACNDKEREKNIKQSHTGSRNAMFSSGSDSDASSKNDSKTIIDPKTADILWGATKTAEIRVLDALLRILRDRLLISADRIMRIEKHCQWRLRWYQSGIGRGWRIWFRKTLLRTTLEDDRHILHLTTAALKRELERLGQVQRLLLSRPRELTDSYLLMASSVPSSTFPSKSHLEKSQEVKTSNVPVSGNNDIMPQQPNTVFTHFITQINQSISKILSSPKIQPWVEKFQRLIFSFTHRKVPISNQKRKSMIYGAGARLALSTAANPKCNITETISAPHPSHHTNWIATLETASGHHLWADVAEQWTQKARHFIRDILFETMAPLDPSSSFDEDEGRHTTVAYDMNLVSKWTSYEKSDEESWLTVLTLVDDISKARLVQEKKYLPTIMDFKYWKKRLDFWGIPSSLATIGCAHALHTNVKPHWPTIIETQKKLAEIIWGIIEFRFYIPIRDIVLDLLNRRPKLLDPFALDNEQRSLDNMLRDLGVKGETRAETIAAASRMYEQQLAQGAILNLMRGQMVRLLLIQVQQLKAGLLQAMGSIDDLMDSNRLNVQLLASIPAVLISYYGTRFFFASLYRLRARDITGPRAAHLAMSELLSKMGRCLHLASHYKDRAKGGSNHGAESSSVDTFLQPQELGEFILYSHEYLTILDFCDPVFPKKLSDAIHER